MTPEIRPLVAGNWKMNGLHNSVEELKKMNVGKKKNLYTKGYVAKMKKFHEEMGKFREDFRWKMQGI